MKYIFSLAFVIVLNLFCWRRRE